ncbi:hypothetical protein [Paenibacillus tianjinensis]|uniref:Uncharacterized protein n=1 Tax=Paenibacillus tianjinensis TaxID=2810347 RepID=A0ABX7L8E5_9BACL|nr:hypothetical protein [Paenibacillus tianjinensis]QSF43546.1 hypothetical protein JRJ22_20000 [Paenibacillus tianjinensis]
MITVTEPHIVMNLANAYEKFSRDDYSKFYDGKYLTISELDTFKGVSASCGILIDNSITSDYEYVNENGNREIGHW